MRDNREQPNPAAGGARRTPAGDAHAPCSGVHYEEAPYYGASAERGATGELLSPGRLLRVVLRKWWLIALGAALGASAAWFYLSRATPLYRTHALVEMSVRRPRIMLQRAPVSDDTDFSSRPSAEVFNTRIEKFRGTRMRELVAAQLQTATNRPPLSVRQIEDVLKQTVFELIRNSSLVRVSCVADDPALASLGANAFAEGAVHFAMEDNRIASESAVVWLKQQAAQQKAVLDRILKRIAAFREAQRMDAIENDKKMLLTALADLGSQVTRIESERLQADRLLAAVQRVELDPGRAADLPDTAPRREEIVKAVSDWLSAMRERETLMARMTPDHPEAVARAKGIAVFGKQVVEAIKRAQTTATANVLLLEQQAAALRETMGERARAAGEMESQIVRLRAELDELERERGAAEMSYSALLTRIEDARISADENTTAVKIVESARPPSKPFAPRRWRTLFLGLLLGLAGGMGIALGVERLEDRFLGTEDMERTLGLPVLGLVPRLRGKQRSVIGRVADAERFGHSAEAYAGIRARIVASAPDSRLCLLVTSTEPREGKTVTASNLAAAFAGTGAHVLLVDFDLRRPKLRSVFGLPDSVPCLLETLGNGEQEAFWNLSVATDCSNLRVVCSRATSAHSPAEVIGRRVVRDFVEWARSAYDVVVLDSPPFGVFSDAFVLAGMVNGVVIVSRPEVSRKRILRGAIEEFAQAGAPLLGIVVNAVRFGRISFLSAYDYRYGHGYRAYKYPAQEAKD